MCIRDRVGGARLGGELGPIDGVTAVAGQRHAIAGLGAVSYTHLRAHETVLDLVCRLLLEKKKINTACADMLERRQNDTIRKTK